MIKNMKQKESFVFFIIFTTLILSNCVHTQASKYYNDGDDLNEKEEYDEAIENFNYALKIDHQYAEAYSGLAYAYFKKGELEQALNYCNKSISINDKLPKNYLYLGYIYNAERNYTEAIKYFNKYIKIKPDDDIVYSNRGSAYIGIGEYDLALQDLTKAINIDPGLFNHYGLRALAYYQLKKYDNALEDLNKTIELDPKNDNAYSLRAVINFDILKNYSKALSDAQIALKINPGNSIAQNVLDVAENNGISLTENGISNVNITIKIDMTINDYLHEYPYLTATSMNTLIDRRFNDTGDLFYYYFDETTKKLKTATWIKISQNKQIWFNNWLTQFLSDGDDLFDASDKTKKLIMNNTPIGTDESDKRIVQILELNNEFAALYFVIEENRK
jgi:tetratricopeptide (TPR) repeat protein